MVSALESLDVAPLLPGGWIAALLAFVAAALVYSAWRGAPGTLWRALAAACLIALLINPRLQLAHREPLADLVFVVLDGSPSQSLGVRQEDMLAARAHVEAELDRLSAGGGLAFEILRVAGGEARESGTRLLEALERAAAQYPAERIAGALLVTDGQVHDRESFAGFPAPVHALISGGAGEFGRSITLIRAPTFGMVRAGVEFEFVVEEFGERPAGVGEAATVELLLDGQARERLVVRPGTAGKMRTLLDHAGESAVELRLSHSASEVTARNNRVGVTVNGIRDKLRVLLVSGSPHSAARVWRNLLKNDPAVELVHLTIVRPAYKAGTVPDTELSLIEFPTRTVFVDELDSFDLVVFDRFRRQGVLSDGLLESVASYVRQGGAVLVAMGSELPALEDVFGSPLRNVLPGQPTGREIEAGFVPAATTRGMRHPLIRPVMAEIEQAGHWYRQLEIMIERGDVLLTGAAGWPLLGVSRVERGRVAVLASDNAWLWARGHDGGGPHDELFRRLAHWLMQEPELEEDALRLRTTEGGLVVTRQTLEASPGEVEIIGPAGDRIEPAMAEIRPGVWRGTVPEVATGLYQARAGQARAFGVVGASDPLEFRDATSTEAVLAPLAAETGGAVRRIADGLPRLRRVTGSATAHGSEWIGFPRRNATAVRGVDIVAPLPAWAGLAILFVTLSLAWWARRGRRLSAGGG